MSALSNIKDNIKEVLNQLAREEILREVIVDDFANPLFERQFAAFPAAILTTPTVDNQAFTNSQNIRSFTFEIVVVLNAKEVQSANTVEDLIENIINKFDNDPTLKAGGSNGVVDGGVEPSSSTPQAVVSRSGSYIAFSVFVRCKKVRDNTYV